MARKTSGVKKIVSRLIFVIGLTTNLQPCVQQELPFLRLSAHPLRGRVTGEGKPIRQSVKAESHTPTSLELHRELPHEQFGYRPYRPASPEILKKVETDQAGYFDFGTVLPGNYRIVTSNPDGEFSIKLNERPEYTPDQRVALDFFADGCERIQILGLPFLF